MVSSQLTARIAALDAARSVALLGMAVFHFVFDLEMFGFVAPGTMQSGLWPSFARLVAGSFLFLAGVSLWLAQGRVRRWRPFLRRLAVLVMAAACISLVTWLALPTRFVYFGILHSIAVASVIGMVCLRLPVFALLALAAAALVAPDFLSTEGFNQPGLWWTGLATHPRPSMDFEPVLPWVAPFLCGLAVAKAAEAQGVWAALSTRGPRMPWLIWPGRHSLAVYLVHQPILLAVVGGAAYALR